MENVALDTSVCIEIIKNKLSGISISERISGSEIFLASVGLFELLLRRTNLEAVEELVGRVNLLSFDEKAARKASDIAKELSSKGETIGSLDIFIAATAIVNNCALATLNIKDFSRIKGLKLLKLH